MASPQTSADVDLLRGWLDTGVAREGLALDRDSRWLVVRRLVRLGAADADLVTTEAAADHSSNGHQASLTALASRPDAAAKADAWRQLTEPGVSNRDFEALVAGLWSAGQEELCAPYVQRYLNEAPGLAARGQAFSQEVAIAAPRFPMALASLQRLRDDLETAADRADDNKVLQRGWRDLVDDLDVALSVRRSSPA